MYKLSDYNYLLPNDRIAQQPIEPRDYSRLLTLERTSGHTEHRRFREIVDCLEAGDLLVVNNTEVIPARLKGKKTTGGKVELLILDYAGLERAEDGIVGDCLVKGGKRIRIDATICFEGKIKAQVIGFKNGFHRLKFLGPDDFDQFLSQQGHMPLPPYIKRGSDSSRQASDRLSYQTIYAAHKGAIAAPTAGLHFTEDIFSQLKEKEVGIACITLHVGYGTFVPVRVKDIRQHQMYDERYTLPPETAQAIKTAKQNGGRVVAVGTTVVRTLEFSADSEGGVTPGSSKCDLFIYPGYRFKVVDALITNFHLPQSTLLMLVSAFAGRETVLSAYQEAITRGYRFYSYGDAMFIY
jgi:S-adenosylmethionine:tRNA ribosyltransferase-isomerase